MHKHFKRQWFTQSIYLHTMLNISKNYLGRNGDVLPAVCVTCLNFAPQCMKLLGNLRIWPTVLDWCLGGSCTQLLLGHYSVRIGYQRKQNWNSYKAYFLNHTFTFYAIGLLDKSCMQKRKKLQYKIPATSSSYYINSEYFRSCWKL